MKTLWRGILMRRSNPTSEGRLGSSAPAVQNDAPPRAPWIRLCFSKLKLAELKSAAIKNLNGEESNVKWISTNNLVTALLCQRVAVAQSARFEEKTSILCYRTVESRRYFDLPAPEGHMSHMVSIPEHALSFEDIQGWSPSAITRLLREFLTIPNEFHVRSVATVLRAERGKTTFKYGPNSTPGRDTMISSWTGLRLSTPDFGPVLGRPTFVRRATHADFEGIAYLMSKTAEGDIDVAISLRKNYHNVLEQDQLWKSFAETIGRMPLNS